MVSWDRQGADSSYSGVEARRFDPTGQPVGRSFLINSSFKDIAGSVRDNVDSKELAETTVPVVMVIVGAVLAVLGFGLFFLWRKRPATASTVGPASPPSGDLGTDPGPAPPVPGDVQGGSMGVPHDPDPHGGSTS